VISISASNGCVAMFMAISRGGLKRVAKREKAALLRVRPSRKRC
jgi:hypothetical protein